MPLDVTRSKFLSNQIDQLVQTAYFTADGTQTLFVVPFEISYYDQYNPSDSAEVEVYENGVLLRHIGGSLEYTVVQDGFGITNTINFITAPLLGHLIDVVYRIIKPKI